MFKKIFLLLILITIGFYCWNDFNGSSTSTAALMDEDLEIGTRSILRQKVIKDKGLHQAFEKILKAKDETSRSIANQESDNSGPAPVVTDEFANIENRELTAEEREDIILGLTVNILNNEAAIFSLKSIGDERSALELEELNETKKKQLEYLQNDSNSKESNNEDK